jgi:FkbH-like protein
MSIDSAPSISIALLSTSSVQLLSDALRTELGRFSWEVRIWQSGFNQYRQDIDDAASSLYSERPQVIIMHLDGEDLFADRLRNPFDSVEGARRQQAEKVAAEVDHCVSVLRERLPETLVVLNTIYLAPVHALTGLEHNSPWNLSDLAVHYNTELRRIRERHRNVLVHDVASLAAFVGYRQWFDSRLWHLARCRLSGEAVKTLARSAGSLLRAWKGQTRKCLVLDLDNTLWGGIVGEDGLDGIALGGEGVGLAFAEFQEELANLTRKGVLLAICSKNNESDALDVLRRHPSARLREDAFAAWRINWRDKASNIRELAAELNIGLESLVFIDDSAAERDLVRTSLPDVYVPDWPQDSSDFKAALLDLANRYFARVSITAEDQARTAVYRSQGERQTLAASGGSLKTYLLSLEMFAEVGFADTFTIPRIAQLTQKTNQFNLTTRRYTEGDVRGMADDPRTLVMWLRLRDRFSDDGVVGVLIAKQCTLKSWIIDSFLLSCRVIGRNVETAFLAVACKVLVKREMEELVGEYLPTHKNMLVSDIYGRLGFELFQEAQGATRWLLAVREKQIAIPEWIAVRDLTEEQHA